MQTSRWSSYLFQYIAVISTLLSSGGAFAVNKDKLLHEFNPALMDGSHSYTVLVFDKAGNLYGTTYQGGGNGCQGELGCGIVFELTPNPDGSWTEQVLYRFQGGDDGGNPSSGITLDQEGNLYGTTWNGGVNSQGTIFKLMQNQDGSWTESVLYSFGNGSEDGMNPIGGMVFDKAGNLYGTTSYGGVDHDYGTVYKLDKNNKETVLHSFNFRDGESPNGVIRDAVGNLYGTTISGGGTGAGGMVFKLSPRAVGGWIERVLYRFGKDGGAGAPRAGVIFDKAGDLYGTLPLGGQCDACGAIFKLTPKPQGPWQESTLYSFTGGSESLWHYPEWRRPS
jgi:uncharacterized repeat protein (TIGR03803 family)